MATKFKLTLIAPDEYNVEKFENDTEIWSVTDPAKTYADRCASDIDRGSVMRVKGKTWTFGDEHTFGDGLYFDDSPEGRNEGVFKDFQVTPNVTYTISFLYRSAIGYFRLVLWDVTNDSLVASQTLNSTSWASYCEAINIPELCNTLRIKFLQADSPHSLPFYIDDLSVNGNVILTDPDSYERVLKRIGNSYQMLSGRKVHDLRAIHYRMNLKWDYVDPVQYELFRQIACSNEILYFDDGDVPPLIEHHTVYEREVNDYTNMESPSTLHIAYKSTSPNLPFAKSDFESEEYTTQEYQAIYNNDDQYCETSNPEAGFYIYHKFKIKSGLAKQGVKRFRVLVSAMGRDTSPHDSDGCILYAHNGDKWVELARSTNSDKNFLIYETSESTIASSFVDADDQYIRLLVRSRGMMRDGSDLTLRVYYVQVELNEGLDSVVRLTHKAILDRDGDLIWVKNLTKGRDLILGTDYIVSIDRRSILIFGQDPGDEIEVKYNRYFECMVTELPERWIYRDGDARQMVIQLQTLSGIK